MPAHLMIADTERAPMRGNRRPRFLDGSDDELIAAAQKSDEVAIRILVQRHNRMLFRLARSILRTDDEAEDAVQAATWTLSIGAQV